MRRAELQLLRGSAGSRLYNITSFDIALVCHQCGIELTDDLVQKFNSLKTRWKTVLPSCSGKCSHAPNKGWITKGETKKGGRPQPKRKRNNIDVLTFVPHSLGVSECVNRKTFKSWLADSKRVWDQLRFDIATKRQIKKRRKNL